MKIEIADFLKYDCDASGNPGDFSDSDKKFAENAGMKYMDVKEFWSLKND